MTTTFPPKPWQEGATFTNETTGVGYTYSGGKWLASGGPKVDGEYLSTKGGDMHGNIQMDRDTCIDGRNADGQNYRMLQFRGGLGLEYKASTSNEYNVINRKALEAELAKLPTPEPTPSPLKKLRFARDKDWNSLRPGEFGLMNDSNSFVGKWSEARQIYFLNVDSDGNRLMRNENAQDFNSYLGSAFTAVTSSGDRPVLRVAPTGQAGGWVKLDYGKDLDLIYIGWTDKNCGALMTGTNDNLSNGQYFLFNLPDLFF